MKKILSLALLSFLAGSALAQNTQYKVSGTVPADVTAVYIITNNDSRQVDSVKVSNGKFEATGTKETNAFITFMKDRQNQYTVVNDGTPVSIDFNAGTVTGSALNNEFTAFQKKQAQETQKMNEVYTVYRNTEDKAKREELIKEIEALDEQAESEIQNYVKQHKNDVTPAFYLSTNYYGYSFEELKAVLDPSTAYYKHVAMLRPKAHLKNLAKRQPGQKFHELEMKDPPGNDVKLSQFVPGHYTLVDFWASWCGPCRQEMPNVLKAYEKYHESEGFEIVGVSFDRTEAAWKKGIETLKMPWPQMSDLKYWECAANEIYGVNSIPSNVLLDPEGNIVACDLRGEGLQKKLAEIYGK